MKTFWFLHGLFLAVVALGTSGCLTHSSFETVSSQSPDGQWILSRFESGTSVFFSLDSPKELSAESKLKLRNHDGKVVYEIPWEKAKSGGDVWVKNTAWSPDSNHFAVLWNWSNGFLDVVEVGQKSRSRLAENVGDFCWVGNSNLVYTTISPDRSTRELWRNRLSVNRALLSTHEIQELFTHSAGDSEILHALSPDGEMTVFATDKAIAAVNFSTTNNLYELPFTNGFKFDVVWDKTSQRCLVSQLSEAEPAGGLPKTTLLLFDRQGGKWLNVEDLMKDIDKDAEFQLPLPLNENELNRQDGVWDSSGQKFLAWSEHWAKISGNPTENSEYYKDWICRAQPWTAVSVQGQLGTKFGVPVFAPQGNILAVLKGDFTTAPDSCDIYVSRLSQDPNGHLILNKPELVVKAKDSRRTQWFWSADGKEIITFTGSSFKRHSVMMGQ